MSSPEETDAGPGDPRPQAHRPGTGQIRDPVPGGPAQPAPDPAGPAARPSAACGRAAGPTARTGRALRAPTASDAAARRPPTADAELAERTADLQRLQAEYANYRRGSSATGWRSASRRCASVLAELLPVLDDIGRAREHGELEGGFKSVGEALEPTVTKLGLEPLRRRGRAVRPDRARGPDARPVRRRDRADLCPDLPARLPRRRADRPARPGSIVAAARGRRGTPPPRTGQPTDRPTRLPAATRPGRRRHREDED